MEGRPLLFLVAALATLAATVPALADCNPSNPGSNTSVTCAPPGTDGVNAPASDNVTLTIQPGTVVIDNGTQAIKLNDNANVTNNGTISAGDNAAGIIVHDNSVGTNAITNNGTISAGDNGAGISVHNGNNIINRGTITVGNGINGVGINGGADNTVVNSGTISVGTNATAIELTTNTSAPNNPNVINSGTIVVGDGGNGIFVNSKHNILNSGTISVGAGAIGIVADGNNTITNTGVITAASGGIGIQLVDPGNVLNNYGTIRGMGLGGSLDICNCATGTTINNYAGGTLDGYISVDGSNNKINNYGLITITDPNTPIHGYPTFVLWNRTGSGTANVFQQYSSGTLALRMNNAGAIDLLYADSITLAGTLRVIIQPQLYGAQTFSVSAVTLSIFAGANMITTTFDHVVSSSPFFIASPLYDTNDPTSYQTLSVELDRVAFGSVPGLTPNQKNVGTALENGYSTGLTGNAATFYGNVLAATSVNVLNQLSGEGTSAAQGASFSAGTNFNMAMMQQGAFWQNGLTGDGNSVTFGEPTAYAEPDKRPGTDAFASVRPTGFDYRWRVWGLGFGATRSIGADATTGASSQTQRTFGGSFGVDHQIAGDLLIGAAVGASQSTFAVPNLSTNGTIDGGHIGVYGVKTWGASYMNAALSYAHFDNSTTRTITGAGPTEVATGNFGSDQINARLEAGRKYALTGYTLTPFVATEPGVLFQRAYSETSTAGAGAGLLGLNYMAHTTPSLPTFVGLQIDTHQIMTNGYAFDPYARVSWVHEFMPKRQIEASFITVPGPSFTVDGARAYTDAARINTGVKVALARDTVAFLNLEGEFASNSQSYSATMGMQTAW
jgi:uncharacterized protein with beta-barrel porin domain